MTTIDFETRSHLDIRKTGHWKYAADPSTEVMCLAIKPDGEPARLWVSDGGEHWVDLAEEHGFAPLCDGEVMRLVRDTDIEAHNAHFEIAIWHHVMHEAYGFPDLDPDRVYCSMAKALRMGLPDALDKLCKALGTEHQKDAAGHRVMMKLCRPRRPTKSNPHPWFEDPEDLIALWRYCLSDAEAEHECSGLLQALPAPERRIWLHDLAVNRRGVTVDVPTVEALVSLVKAYEVQLLGEVGEITAGTVTSPRQRDASLAWLQSRGAVLPDLTKSEVADALEDMPPSEAKRFLELRQELSRASTAKLDKMLHMRMSDNRIRGMLQYHAATTGRWGGRGVQLQNLPRLSAPCPDIAAELLAADDTEMLDLLYGAPTKFASGMIRSCLTAAPGHDLICADYSSIEGRLLAWLADETWVLDAYRAREDLYRHSASVIYGIAYDEVGDPSPERQVGKVAELALGYGGGRGAFQEMATSYGVTLPDAQVQQIVKAWRDRRPATTHFWYTCEDAAMKAVRNPHQAYTVRACTFTVDGSFLTLQLPSGRRLYYLYPRIEPTLTSWGETKNTITYMGTDSRTHQWCRQKTWGGKIVENITQACARDVLAAGVLRVEEAGYPVLFHVHDECVSEVLEGSGQVSEYERLLAENPQWCPDLPLAAKGWRGKRYRK